jgi:hypothetical protein
MAYFLLRRIACLFSIINPLETIMRKIIALAIAGFVWKKLQSRFRSRSRSGY